MEKQNMKRLIIVAVMALTTAAIAAPAPVTTWLSSPVTGVLGVAQVSTTKYVIAAGTNYCRFNPSLGTLSNLIGSPLVGLYQSTLGWTDGGKLLAVDLAGKPKLVGLSDLLWVSKPTKDTTSATTVILTNGTGAITSVVTSVRITGANTVSLPATNTITIVNVAATRTKYDANASGRVGFLAIGPSTKRDAPTLICISDNGKVSHVEFKDVLTVTIP
jgi:hypothetical protein